MTPQIRSLMLGFALAIIVAVIVRAVMTGPTFGSVLLAGIAVLMGIITLPTKAERAAAR